MRLALVSLKGGTGKSTIGCLLGLHWATTGRIVRLRDLDRTQRTGESFVRLLAHPRLTLDVTDPDITILDAPGGMAPTDLHRICHWADLVLIPMGLSPADYRATRRTIELLEGDGKLRLLLTRLDRRTAVYRDRAAYAEDLGVKTLTATLPQRHGYQLALATGWPALDAAARADLGVLAAEIEAEAQTRESTL